MQFFKKSGLLALALITGLIFPLVTQAAGGSGPSSSGPSGPVVVAGSTSNPAESYPVSYDGKTNFTVGQYKVEVDNGQSSSLSILSDGKTTYQKKIDLGRVANVYKWDVADQSYLVVTYRLDGSGSYISFDVLKLGADGQLEKVYQSKSYEHGGVKVSGQTLSLTYPIYKKGDPQTEPSALKKENYQLSNGELTLANDEKQSLDYGYMHTMGTGTDATSTPQTITDTTKCSDVTDQPNIDCGTNPSTQKIASLLTKYALKYDVPPEIVKAIAWDESGWNQYWTYNSSNYAPCQKHVTGHVVVSYDCQSHPNRPGLGIMQYTSYDPSNTTFVNQLKSDIEFNIEQGVQLLQGKWNLNYPLIPKINNSSPDVLENWYFAIMAYNGVSKKNDPTIDSNSPYQEKIYNSIRTKGLAEITPFPVNMLDTYYNPNSTRIQFKHSQFNIPGPYHLTKQNFVPGDNAFTTDTVNFRPAPNTNSENPPTLAPNTKLTIIADPQGRDVPIADADDANHYVWYPVKVLNGSHKGQTGYVYSSSLVGAFDLYSGTPQNGGDRYETSVAIADRGWPNGSNVVVLARGDLPPDALAGTVLAKKYNAPILLTQTDQLPGSVNNELDKMKPAKIYLLGGPAAISDSIYNKLKAKGYTTDVIRLRGANHNRYGTALEVAKAVDGADTHALIIASGDEKSPDALSASPYAGSHQIPILLTGYKSLDPDVKQYVKNISGQISKVYIIGGPNAAVSPNVKNQLIQLGIGKAEIVRVAGDDRYSTSVAVANQFDYDRGRVFFAHGAPGQYIDALSGAPLAAIYDAPVILTQENKTPSSVEDLLTKKAGIPRLYYLGGYGAIDANVRNNIQQILVDTQK